MGNSKIKLQPHIIKRITEYQEENLTTKKGLRSWLGILNYARNYIPNLGKLLGPLYAKTSPTGEKRFNEQDWELIRKIKSLVKNLPDLEVPPEECFIILETDGCMEGWGGICKWKKMKNDPRNTEKICAYASGKFNPIKSTIDAEMHAVMKTLESLKIYFLDKEEVIIRTDCQAIISFFNKSAQNKPSRVRWMAFVDYITGCGVEVKFEHIEGTSNILADSLSRLINILVAGWPDEQAILMLEATKEVQARPSPRAAAYLNQFLTTWQNNTYRGSPSSGQDPEQESPFEISKQLKKSSKLFKERPPDKPASHYGASSASTQQRRKNTKGGVEEKTTGTKTGYQLSFSSSSN